MKTQNNLSILIFSSTESMDISTTLRRELYGYSVKIWNYIFDPGNYSLDDINDAIKQVDFVISIMHGDDEIIFRNEKWLCPRDNVVLETGLAMGLLGKERVFMLCKKGQKIKIPTDLNGITRLYFDQECENDLCSAVGRAVDVLKVTLNQLGKHESNENKYRNKLLDLENRFDLETGKFKGCRLFQYEGYYPLKLNEKNIPSIDYEIFKKALSYFVDDKFDKLAASDLVYLRLRHIKAGEDFLDSNDFPLFEKLLNKYGIDGEGFIQESELIIENLCRILDDLGDTFSGVHTEFILHDVRDPVHSISAAKNTEGISNRKVGEPSTRYVLTYVKNQGAPLLKILRNNNKDKLNYLKRLYDTKNVKATTIPIEDPRYGLVAILCINVDIEKIIGMSNFEKEDFFVNYCKITSKTPPNEK